MVSDTRLKLSHTLREIADSVPPGKLTFEQGLAVGEEFREMEAVMSQREEAIGEIKKATATRIHIIEHMKSLPERESNKEKENIRREAEQSIAAQQKEIVESEKSFAGLLERLEIPVPEQMRQDILSFEAAQRERRDMRSKEINRRAAKPGNRGHGVA